MTRVLLLSTTTGYQTRAFGDAAARLGVDLAFATDRCEHLDDPWRDGAVAIRFHKEEASTRAIVDASRARPIAGILALGDRPTVIAALAAQALGLPGNPPEAAAISRNKLRMRERFRAARLPVPWFVPLAIDAALPTIEFPCVVKPLLLSGSRGVIRADDPVSLDAALARVTALLRQPDVTIMRDAASHEILIEQYIPGHEYALEGVIEHGTFRVLAIFDKPDPLEGPFFEETIYVTMSRPEREAGLPPPPRLRRDRRSVSEGGQVGPRIEQAVRRAIEAMGLRHGPVHAEVRVNDAGVFVLEVAARPIGGLCARALRFVRRDKPEEDPIPLEELLLRHAIGESVEAYQRESAASGVMMIPIPARGIFRGVEGLDAAARVPHVAEVRITAKPEQPLMPLPEGASYLGFIFARAATPREVERALRDAHACLRFDIQRELTLVR